MSDEKPYYISYLLRLRRATGRQGAVWRVSLESPGSGERHSFATLEEMLSFLREKTGGPEGQPEVPQAD